jgi:sulfite exporter TauE/SafE
VTGMHFVPVFMIGLLGSVHCIGMCGGIVSALSVASGNRRTIPIAVVRGSGAIAHAVASDDTLRVIAYNAGRIASYAAAGAIAGGIAQGVRTFSAMSSFQIGGYWLANLMLVALGLYLMDIWHGLVRLEAAGQLVWRRIQPLMKHVLPMDSPAKALVLGALWGWVPCGMVYSVLLTAMLSGSASSGAAVMVAFGLGTMPMLLMIGLAGSRLQAWRQHRKVRLASGLIVLCFGLFGMVKAATGLPLGWLDAICITPAIAGAHG